MNKQPINPVTIIGKPYNVAFGRMWLGQRNISDGQARFDPKQGAWEKPMPVVIWGGGEHIRASMVLPNENQFIKVFKCFQKGDKLAVMEGPTTRDSTEILQLTLSRNQNELVVQIADDYGRILGATNLNYDKFVEGMSHLFVKGELDDV